MHAHCRDAVDVWRGLNKLSAHESDTVYIRQWAYTCGILVTDSVCGEHAHRGVLTTACSHWYTGAIGSADMLFMYRLNNPVLSVGHKKEPSDFCRQKSTNFGVVSLLNPVYTIQPVVKPVVQPVWQPAVSCINKHPTGCQTGLITVLTTVLNEQLFVQPVVKPCRTTGLTTGLTTGCIVYTSRLSNRFDNRFDNRLYRVNGALDLKINGICGWNEFHPPYLINVATLPCDSKTTKHPLW